MVINNINTAGYMFGNNVPNWDNNLPKQNKNSRMILVKVDDNKYVVMTPLQYIHYIKNKGQTNNPNTREQEQQNYDKPYELGPQRGNTRIIDINNVTPPLNPGTSEPRPDRCPIEQLQNYRQNLENPNWQIDDFRQGKRGDCYFLAAIESIKRTDNGQQILKNNIVKNSDGSYTVTLPGAVNARNHYIEQGNGEECAITGTYRISAQALEKAKGLSGQSYAYGDIEVILYELAMEAFRAEIAQTNEALGLESNRFIAGQFGPLSDIDTLSGGLAYDAVYILTGNKSDLYSAPKEKRRNPPKYYIPGEYGYVDENSPNAPNSLKAAKGPHGIVEINNLYDKESDLQRMLDQYKGRENEFAINVGVIVGKDGPDGVTKAKGGHALTVKKITDTYVEVINPWDTTKVERIPRGDFEKMAMSFSVAKIEKKANTNSQSQDENSFRIPDFSELINPFSIIFPWLSTT